MSRPPLALAGRTAIVTGAGSGIGRALALKAAAEGMAVAICDVSSGGLDETRSAVAELGGTVVADRVDVSDEASVGAFAARVAAEAPPIALLFANAGVLRAGPVASQSLAEWRFQYEVNVIGAVATVQSFLPAMIASGLPSQIVITGSTGSMSMITGLGAYCGTKHALWAITDVLRAEIEAEGHPIGTSLLMPGAVATQIFDASNPDRPAPADSITPARAAEITFDGAFRDLPLILTHPHFVDRAKARFDEAVRALLGRD